MLEYIWSPTPLPFLQQVKSRAYSWSLQDALRGKIIEHDGPTKAKYVAMLYDDYGWDHEMYGDDLHLRTGWQWKDSFMYRWK
jgi:hypothetical protein